jgi:hypothetical protein
VLYFESPGTSSYTETYFYNSNCVPSVYDYVYQYTFPGCSSSASSYPTYVDSAYYGGPQPSTSPSLRPTGPTMKPTSARPTKMPTPGPTSPTRSPTVSPTSAAQGYLTTYTYTYSYATPFTCSGQPASITVQALGVCYPASGYHYIQSLTDYGTYYYVSTSMYSDSACSQYSYSYSSYYYLNCVYDYSSYMFTSSFPTLPGGSYIESR